jgi:iron complex transport system permease protein
VIRALRALGLRLALLRERPRFWAAGLAAALVASALLAARVGAVELSALDVLRAALDREHPLHAAIWDVRLPRVACGAAVGAALAVSGALLQAVVRNPLADPGIMGVTAGAGLAAITTIVLFPERAALVPAFAFAGGLGAVAVLLLLAWRRGSAVGPLRLVLSGVALQAVFIAGIALLTFAFADRAPAFAAFLVGSLGGLGWSDLVLVLGPTLVGLALALAAARPLNLLLFDDATAGGVGLAVRRARFGASSLAAFLAACAVSVAGLVGFVGLVVPNAVRVAAGPDHRVLLPLAALGGATLVLLADTVSRVALPPLELPVGALLALLGGPYFLWLLWRRLA